jgi:alkylation response protein AidB-like acyl-CoA dehydrogenase
MSREPADEIDELRDAVRRLLRERSPLSSAHAAYDAGAGLDRDLWRRLGELGLTGLAVPEQLGGAGAGAVEVGVVVSELGRVLARTPYLSSAAVVTSVLATVPAGAPAVTDTLRRLAAGDWIAAPALWEKAASWEPGVTSLRLSGVAGSAGRLAGTKIAVPFAADADVLLTFARDAAGDLHLLIVDRSAVAPAYAQSLDRTTPLYTVSFDGTPGTVVASGEGAERAARAALNFGAVHRANESVGSAQACLDASVAYSLQRVQFDRPIGSQQAVKHLCADVLVELELARGAADAATAELTDLGSAPDGAVDALASLAKSLASAMFLSAADTALHIHGGMGFTWEQDSHLFLRRARAASLDFGDVAFHRDRFLASSPLTSTAKEEAR